MAPAWLRADLELLRKQPEGTAKRLRRWQRNPNLAGVRDGDDLSDDWKKLWADVAELRKKASGK